MQYTVPIITSLLLPKVMLFTIVRDYPVLKELKMKINKLEVLILLLAF